MENYGLWNNESTRVGSGAFCLLVWLVFSLACFDHLENY